MSKPTVTLTLAGDESKLTDAFDQVGRASTDMADKVEKSSKSMEDTGKGIDSLGESTDAAEGKFQGFADTLTGTQDIMTGFREGDIVGMATGFADLAGGLTEFLIPAISSFATFMMGPLRAAMTFIAAHPLLIFFGLLVAAVILLWTTSEDFRNVMIRVFDAVGSFIMNVFGGVIDWLVGAWNGVIGFFSGFGDAIGRALGNIGGFFKSAFKGAANLAIDAVNWMIDQINKLIYGVNVINPFEDIPDIPKLRRMHTGGIVPGMAGQEVPILAMSGERLVPSGQSGGGGTTVHFSGNTDTAFARAFMKLVNNGAIRVG